jgi:hypothetical protein
MLNWARDVNTAWGVGWCGGVSKTTDYMYSNIHIIAMKIYIIDLIWRGGEWLAFPYIILSEVERRRK